MVAGEILRDLGGSTPGVRVGAPTAEAERWPEPLRSLQTWPVFSPTTSPAQSLALNIVPFPNGTCAVGFHVFIHVYSQTRNVFTSKERT